MAHFALSLHVEVQTESAQLKSQELFDKQFISQLPWMQVPVQLAPFSHLHESLHSRMRVPLELLELDSPPIPELDEALLLVPPVPPMPPMPPLPPLELDSPLDALDALDVEETSDWVGAV